MWNGAISLPTRRQNNAMVTLYPKTPVNMGIVLPLPTLPYKLVRGANDKIRIVCVSDNTPLPSGNGDTIPQKPGENGYSVTVAPCMHPPCNEIPPPPPAPNRLRDKFDKNSGIGLVFCRICGTVRSRVQYTVPAMRRTD